MKVYFIHKTQRYLFCVINIAQGKQFCSKETFVHIFIDGSTNLSNDDQVKEKSVISWHASRSFV